MSFLWNWVRSWLQSFGLMNKTGTLLLLGLDNAGKTTLMGLLKTGALQVHPPTFQPTSEELSIANITITAFDLGGHVAARRLWKEYAMRTDGIVYLVDCAETKERMEESRKALSAIMAAAPTVPVVIMGNKIDAKGALSESVLKAALGVEGDCVGKATTSVKKGVRPLEVFMCSVAKKAGHEAPFKWLSNFIGNG